MIRAGVGIAAAAGALGMSGCLGDDSIYSSGGDPKVKREVQAVVKRNLAAFAQGDGATYCSTYTPRYLRIYRDGYTRCVAVFKHPRPGAPAPRITFTDFLTASDRKVAVEFRREGSSRVQSYNLEYTAPPRQVGTGRRWLIDLEGVSE